VLCEAGEDVELESGVLTEKLGTSLTSDFERLKLSAVCNLLLLNYLCQGYVFTAFFVCVCMCVCVCVQNISKSDERILMKFFGAWKAQETVY